MTLRPRGFHSIRRAVQLGVTVAIAASLIALLGLCGACIERAAAQAVTSVRAEVVEPGLSFTEEQAAAVRIDVYCFNGEIWQGSGVVVDAQHVLTAAHVVDCPGRIIVGADTMSPVAMRLEAFSLDADLARLVTATAVFSVHPALRVGTVREGEIICAAVVVPERTWSCGVVVAVTSEASDSIVHTAGVMHGNSGSGVYNATGVLVGVLTECHMVESVPDSPCRVHGGNASALAGRAWMVRP